MQNMQDHNAGHCSHKGVAHDVDLHDEGGLLHLQVSTCPAMCLTLARGTRWTWPTSWRSAATSWRTCTASSRLPLRQQQHLAKSAFSLSSRLVSSCSAYTASKALCLT